MTAPNIRPAQKPHSECWRLEWNRLGLPGDVRRCTHGKVQVRKQTGIDSPMQGPGTDWWYTLSPFWDRKTYKRAVEALERANEHS